LTVVDIALSRDHQKRHHIQNCDSLHGGTAALFKQGFLVFLIELAAMYMEMLEAQRQIAIGLDHTTLDIAIDDIAGYHPPLSSSITPSFHGS
jgi:hypothetical protein